MRITGLSSGMDIDSLVSATMQAERIKIDRVQQKSDLEAIRQKLYRETIKEVRTFYEKYFDPANKNSLLLSKNFQDIYAVNSNGSSASTVNGGVTSDKTNVVIGSGVSTTNSSYKVQIDKVAKSAKYNLKSEDFKDAYSIEINYGGEIKTVTVSQFDNGNDMVTELNNSLKDLGIEAKYNTETNEIELATTKVGFEKDGAKNFSITVKKADSQTTFTSSDATNAEFKIISSGGQVLNYTGENSFAGNKVTFEGVEFEIKDEGVAIVKNTSSSSSSNGTSGSTSNKLEDKIEEFIEDYNKLIISLNTKISTKYDRDYQPLTKTQKEEMTEDEIKLWNEKLEEGQLYRDMHLTKLTNSLKSAMSTVVQGSGLKLKDLGISLKSEYGVKNGTYTFDKEKFTENLEYNFDQVKEMFTGMTIDDSITETEKYQTNGIFVRMKNLIYDEVYSSSSNFLKKVGYEGSATFTNNTIKKNIEKYKQKIKEMEAAFTLKENALYKQYSSMESALASLNSQSNYLASMLGMG